MTGSRQSTSFADRAMQPAHRRPNTAGARIISTGLSRPRHEYSHLADQVKRWLSFLHFQISRYSPTHLFWRPKYDTGAPMPNDFPLLYRRCRKKSDGFAPTHQFCRPGNATSSRPEPELTRPD